MGGPMPDCTLFRGTSLTTGPFWFEKRKKTCYYIVLFDFRLLFFSFCRVSHLYSFFCHWNEENVQEENFSILIVRIYKNITSHVYDCVVVRVCLRLLCFYFLHMYYFYFSPVISVLSQCVNYLENMSFSFYK